MNYTMSKGARNLLLVFLILGALALVYGFVAVDTQRLWANLLVNGLYFTFLALAGTFFVAIQYAGEAGWSAGLKRIPEAMGQYLPIGAVVLLIIFGAAATHQNHLYHWMDPYLTQETTTVAELRQYEDDQAAHHGAHEKHAEEAGHGHDGSHGDAGEHGHGDAHEVDTHGDGHGEKTKSGAHHGFADEMKAYSEHHGHTYASKYEHEAPDTVIDNPYYDSILDGKKGFLNLPFFIGAALIYLLGWVFFTWRFRKLSLADNVDNQKRWFIKMRNLAAWFLVFFAVTSSTSAWHWVMSIDPHWFSTLFGWYIFAGLFVSGIATIILILTYLKLQGYMGHVNENHMHDLGKFMFAFSIFWTYLWFSQYMLIWYANIPEEVTYFQDRWENYHFLWIFNLVINFIFPFLVLMTRNSKRSAGTLLFVGAVLIIGHWLDMFLMVMPGTVKGDWGFGFLEIGLFLGFAGLFGMITMRALSKAPLVATTHPFLEEAEHHHV